MDTQFVDDLDPFTPYVDHEQRQRWRAAVADVAAKAHEKLPECNGRINSAVKMVLAGDVILQVDGSALVGSQSEGSTTYHVANGHCDCKDFAKALHGFCKHRLSAAIARRAQELLKAQPTTTDNSQGEASKHPAPATAVDPSPLPERVETPQGVPTQHEEQPSLPEALKSYVVHLHGRTFIRYAGLLALAHERGLVQLTARIEYHSDALVLASATATFQDGRVFTEGGDATPGNVGVQVRPHWVRIALTRAKSRALRDALQIGVAALEELADE